MGALKDRLRSDLTTAIKARDEVRSSTVRMLLAAITNAEVAGKAAGVNITTVYRTLELLEELQLVTHAHLSHGAPTYHPLGEHQHAHLVCRGCGDVQELPSPTLEGLAEDLRTTRGFRLDIGHVALFGVCGNCGTEEE